ncbi:MAG: ACP S-malonyltransferase [Candidatus Binataceae bacterium]
MKLALLFPGQGSQKVGMGSQLFHDFPSARSVFEQADSALGMNLSRLCFEGPEEDLRLTANTQPAILTTSIAALRALQSEFQLAPELAAGHSLGEYSALVAAGALDFGDAVRAVRQRGQFMQEACPPGQGAMAALIGLATDVVGEVCTAASTDGEIVVPANLNAPGQIVVAGHAPAVRRAVGLAKERGGRMSVELNVSAPFHCSLMKPAQEAMAPVLQGISVKPLRFGVIANVSAQINQDPTRVVPLLLEQITAPVRWEESMRTLAGAGISNAIELGAGRVLAGLMRRISREVSVAGVEDPASLAAVVKTLEGGQG